MAKIVTISNKNTNKCHKVEITISDTHCIVHFSQQLEDNTAVSLCDCDKEKYKTASDDDDNEKIEKKIALESKCQAMVDGMPLFGTRQDICVKGKMPETRSQREEKIRQVEVWNMYHIAEFLRHIIIYDDYGGAYFTYFVSIHGFGFLPHILKLRKIIAAPSKMLINEKPICYPSIVCDVF